MKSLKLAFTGCLAAAVLCLAPVTAAAQGSGMDLLKKMEEKFQGLKSVSGEFTQQLSDSDKAFADLKKPTPTAAHFSLLKPNFFRAEYQDAPGQPPSVQLISGQMFYNYVPQLKQVTTYKFQGASNVRDLNYLLLGFGAKADEVQRVYSVEAVKNGVKLTPRNPQEASFRYIIMHVDPQSLYPTDFAMKQSDGKDLVVKMNLGTLKINPPLSPGNFQPNFPKEAARVSM